MTPLHYAAREGHCEVVKHLVKEGAQVNSKDKDNVWIVKDMFSVLL